MRRFFPDISAQVFAGDWLSFEIILVLAFIVGFFVAVATGSTRRRRN